MTDQSADILPTNQSIGGITDQLTGVPLHFPARKRWLAAMIFASALLLLFVVSVVALFTRGVGIWGINIPVNWAFAIHNYVWWLGIGHAGTLISAMLLLTRKRMAQLAQSVCRNHDTVRGGMRRHLSGPASRAALVPLLDVSLPIDDGCVAAVPQSAGMGHLGGPDLSHGFARVLVHRPHSRSRRRARPRQEARAGSYFSGSRRWAGAAPPFTGCAGRRPIG